MTLTRCGRRTPAQSFRGALLREPGIHTPRPVVMDSGLAGKSPRPGMTPQMIRNSKPLNSLGIRIYGIADHPEALDQFADAVVKRVFRAISGRFDAGIGDDVVALVRVPADRSLEVDELRHVGLDAFAQLGLGEVGVRKPHVIGAAAHVVEIVDRMQKRARYVANVKVVALE